MKDPIYSLKDFGLKVTAIKGFRQFTSILAAILFLIPGPAQAEEPVRSKVPLRSVAAGRPAVAPDPVEDVIRRQMDAIKARNAELAFSLTTADFHEKFANGKKFFGNLRFENRPIYNHDSYTFQQRRDVPGGFLQTVEVRDRYDYETPVTVMFRVEQQPDGSWLIDSFTVLDTEGQAL